MFKKLFLLPVFAMIGCVQATVSDTVTKSTEVQVANPYPQLSTIGLPSTTLPVQSVPVDISDTLSKITQAGTIDLNVNENTVHSVIGDFSYIDEVKMTLAPDSNNTSGLPEITIIDVQLTPAQKTSSDLELLPVVDGNTLLTYFSSGGLNMNFTFTVSGHVPASGLDVIDTLTVSVSAQINKSVNDIGSIGK